ncbi:MAG TPA: hypothetical protein VHB69_11415 [Mycobacteriales bacterium]|nr:hypothetical protein [Mycobacteriales bacterium]
MAGEQVECDLTLCIVVTDAGAPLQRTIDALVQIEAPKDSFDVVVVDGTGGNATGVITWPPVLHHIEVTAPAGASLGAMYNLGWRAGNGVAVAFVAADAVVDPSWFAQITAATRRGRRLVMGRWLPSTPSLPEAGPLSYRLWASPRDASLVPTGNFAVRRTDLEAVGGFEESDADLDSTVLDLAARLVEDGVEPYRARHAVLLGDVPQWTIAEMLADRRRTAAAVEFLAERPIARSQLLAGGVIREGAQAQLVLLLLGLALSLRDRRYLAFTLPWLHGRTCTNPRAAGYKRRWFVLPGAFVMDGVETGLAVRARLRNALGRR